MAEIVALLRRQDCPELLLHLLRLLAVGKSQPSADADAVGVADHASRHGVNVPQQQIGGLPPHAGQAQQLLHGAGHLAAVVFQKHLTGQNDVPGLVLVEAAGADVVFHIRNVRCRHGLQRGVGGKQSRGDKIHPGIRALGGKPHGDHQLVILLVVQGTQSIGIAVLQNIYNGIDFFFHIRHSFCAFSLWYHRFLHLARLNSRNRAPGGCFPGPGPSGRIFRKLCVLRFRHL